MGAKGSSGATYSIKNCEECGKFPQSKWGGGKWLCGYCYAQMVFDGKANEMPTPSFTLQEINSAEDLVTKLSNQ